MARVNNPRSTRAKRDAATSVPPRLIRELVEAPIGVFGLGGPEPEIVLGAEPEHTAPSELV